MSETLKVDINRPDEKILQRAAAVIRLGGVIVYPTETLYGIGANAFDARAVTKVINVKKRRDNKPILVVIGSRELLPSLTVRVSNEALMLMNEFWPGPLTLVFNAVPQLPESLSGGTGTIGVRVPSSPLCLKLITLCDCPLTSTSANISETEVPRSVADIERALHGGVDLYLDGGILPESMPSTVVDVTHDVPKLLRHGAVSFERIQHIIPHVQL